MADNQFGSPKSLRNLASALRDTHHQLENGPKLPLPTDQDILRAMLGKPFRPNAADATQTPPARKAG
jgi:hypothetical protein